MPPSDKPVMSNAEFEARQLAIVLAHLETATGDEVHQFVLQYNWDDSLAPLLALALAPATEPASILCAYWKTAPRYMHRFRTIADSGIHRAEFELVELIERNYVAGFYRPGARGWDPRRDEQGYDWTADYADDAVVSEIPDVMKVAVPGAMPPPADGYENGLPLAVFAQIEALLAAYDVR